MTTTPQKFSSFAVFLCMQGLENKFYCCFLKYQVLQQDRAHMESLVFVEQSVCQISVLSAISKCENGAYCGRANLCSKGLLLIRHYVLLKWLTDAVRCRQGKLWRCCLFIFDYDKVPSHSLLQPSWFLARKDISSMNYPPHSPNLPPSDFQLSPELKSFVKGVWFQTSRVLNIPWETF